MYWAVDVLPHTHSALTCTLLTLMHDVHDQARDTGRTIDKTGRSGSARIRNERDHELMQDLARALPAARGDFVQATTERRLADHLGIVRDCVDLHSQSSSSVRDGP